MKNNIKSTITTKGAVQVIKDELGRVKMKIDSNCKETMYEYYGNTNRISRITDSLGFEFHLNKSGSVVYEKLPNTPHDIEIWYNRKGRTIKEIFSSGTEIHYWNNGHFRYIKDKKNGVEFWYNHSGNMIIAIDPENGRFKKNLLGKFVEVR